MELKNLYRDLAGCKPRDQRIFQFKEEGFCWQNFLLIELL
jgi:hypothetical protein